MRFMQILNDLQLNFFIDLKKNYVKASMEIQSTCNSTIYTYIYITKIQCIYLKMYIYIVLPETIYACASKQSWRSN